MKKLPNIRDHADKLLNERRALLTDLAETDKAYLAGLIDGEGCVGAFKRERTNTTICSPYVSIANTNPAMIEWIREKIPFGTATSRKSKITHWKDHLTMQWGGDSAIALLECVFPYLVLKSEQARNVIGLRKSEIRLLKESKRTRFSKVFKVPDWLQTQRQIVAEEIKRLNMRGKAA